MGDIKISYFNKPKRSQRGRHIPRYTPWGYCFDKWDHIIPYSLVARLIWTIFMPACHACKGLLSDKRFNTIDEKREYVRLHKRSNRIIEIPMVAVDAVSFHHVNIIGNDHVLFTDVSTA